MGVYIKGMEMPFAGSIKTIVIYPDGTVRTIRQDPLPYTAVPVPPHGRLIDADEYKQEMKDCRMAFWDEVLDSMPTIIPAEEGE